MTSSPVSSRIARVLSVLALLGALHGCRARTDRVEIIQPGAPGEASRTIDPADAADLSGVRYTPADVRFMQGMISHHAQALEMTALIPSRSASQALRLLGKRIELSQADEIRMMEDWLRSRGQQVPDAHAHHGHAAAMPGMLTAEEMERLRAAKGPEFDRLFLQFMIKHHEGALTMVGALFRAPGAGQEPEVFAFASDVEADQQMEIDRMSGLLQEPKR